ncbi:MAG: gluconokinase [Pseudomonadota bacterium]
MAQCDEEKVPLLVIMGVAGSGKTTVGRELAQRLGWPFFEGDDFHPLTNVEKMASGSPLTDEDRRAWIDAILHDIDAGGAKPAVLACSALSPVIRAWLGASRHHRCHWVLLEISEDEARRRVAARHGHFMPAALIASQFAALSPPSDAVCVNATVHPSANTDVIVAAISAQGVLAPSTAHADTV